LLKREAAEQPSSILVVEDEPDMRFLLRRIFTRAGHEVTEAGDGAAALASVRESLPDLVVTDMMMPMMNGVDLIRRLRADPVTAANPILSVSEDCQLAVAADAALETVGPLIGGHPRFAGYSATVAEAARSGAPRCARRAATPFATPKAFSSLRDTRDRARRAAR